MKKAKQCECSQKEKLSALDYVADQTIRRLKKIERQVVCPHSTLNISIDSDGYVHNATCRFCEQAFCVNGWNRRFSSRRIYKMFVKEKQHE